MRVASIIFAMLAAAAQSGAPPAASGGYDGRDGYQCGVRADGPFGSVLVFQGIGPDGRRSPVQILWQGPPRSPGVTLSMMWIAAELGPPGDEASAHLAFDPGRRAGSARLVLGYGAGTPDPDELVLATRFGRRPIGIAGRIRWRALRRLAEEPEPLIAAVVRRNGALVAHDRIEPAWLDWPAAAVAAVRGDYEQAMADPAGRCGPPSDDIMI